MKKQLFLIALLLGNTSLFAQKYLGRAVQVVFEASTSLEQIRPVNNEVAGIIDAATGDVVFEVLIRSFKFDKALMQEHFNENYLESDLYPKAVFKGKITDLRDVNFSKDGSYTVSVSGKLTIHGLTKSISIPASIKVDKGKLHVAASFNVRPADFNIEIPALVRNKVAESVGIKINGILNRK
jgi:polyisoprenoid-binding protein YceI